MIAGFWIVRIQPPPVTTGGVIVFIDGKVFGGDNAFSWIGRYREDDRLLQARLQVHNFDPEVKSVLDVTGDYEMHFTGTVHGDVITGTAMIANQPGHSLGIRLEKYSAL